MSGQVDCIVFGFDSAWTDNPKAPGAICALGFDASGEAVFHAPELVSFAQAAEYVRERREGYSLSLIALDQPSVVPNAGGGVGHVVYGWRCAACQSRQARDVW